MRGDRGTAWCTSKRGALRRAEGRRRQSHEGADGRTGLGRARAAECEKREENRHTLALYRRALPFRRIRSARSAVSNSACSAASWACAVTSWAEVPANSACAERRSASTTADTEVDNDATLAMDVRRLWRCVMTSGAVTRAMRRWQTTRCDSGARRTTGCVRETATDASRGLVDHLSTPSTPSTHRHWTGTRTNAARRGIASRAEGDWKKHGCKRNVSTGPQGGKKPDLL
ncbi:hypothetical protein FB451DRAFT_1434741 [Mycena latifolia]|nr:hypothetical protein FB451DRAFT_1434741 [Mycena latifolia]